MKIASDLFSLESRNTFLGPVLKTHQKLEDGVFMKGIAVLAENFPVEISTTPHILRVSQWRNGETFHSAGIDIPQIRQNLL